MIERLVTDLADLTDRERCVYLEGRTDGRAEGLTEGFALGWRAANEEIAALQRAASGIVRTLARAPVRNHAQDQRQADQRSQYWAERRATPLGPAA